MCRGRASGERCFRLELIMSAFIDSLRTNAVLTDGAMGSYLFALTGRLSERNHVYEQFNIEHPQRIRDVHNEYLAAGATCITTNTFGANRNTLTTCGAADQIRAINDAGVALAREAIAQFEERADSSFYVLASIGPSNLTQITPAAIDACFGEQVDTLIDAKPDALLLETFDSLCQLQALIEYIRSRPHAPPIIATMTVAGLSADDDTIANCTHYIEQMSALSVPVAGINCCAPWDAITFLEATTIAPTVANAEIILAVMPNAGGFQRIGNRFMSSVNPEYMGKFARTAANHGVRLIGGCCEVHPPHIREMRNYLHARQSPGTTSTLRTPRLSPDRQPADTTLKYDNGPFSRKLIDGQFAISVEMLPPRGTNAKALETKTTFVERLASSGLADAIDITDGSRGIALMPPSDFVHITRQKLAWTEHDKIEFIPHFTARDLNAMGIQARLVGYHAARIHNVLFVTGDPPKMAPTYPRSTAVFDFDSVAMIAYTQKALNAGVDFGGQPLGRHDDPRAHFTIGTGFEPEAVDIDSEVTKLEQKLAAGADYVMTQPAFRTEPLAILEPFRDRVPILVGIMILTSLAHAQRMANVPGVIVPNELFERLSHFSDTTDQAQAAAEFAAQQLAWVRKEGWAGAYIMSPASTKAVFDVLQQP